MGPALLRIEHVDGLQWAQCCLPGALPMGLKEPNAAHKRSFQWPWMAQHYFSENVQMDLNGPSAAQRIICQCPLICPAMSLREAATGAEWAQCSSQALSLKQSTDFKKQSQSILAVNWVNAANGYMRHIKLAHMLWWKSCTRCANWALIYGMSS